MLKTPAAGGSTLTVFGDLDEYCKQLRDCFFSQFPEFMEAIKKLNSIDYKILSPEDQDALSKLRKRYGDLLSEITRVCNESIRRLNKMKRSKTRETLQAQFDEFNWTDYAQLQKETQALQIDVNVLRHACEKYKQDNVFLASLFLTLAAATVAVGTGLACLVAAPVAVTVILGVAAGAAGLVALSAATLTLQEYVKMEASRDVQRIQSTLQKTEDHLRQIAEQQNKILDKQDDYDEVYEEMKEYVTKLTSEIMNLRNLATRNVTF